jgi:hypothetical protein
MDGAAGGRWCGRRWRRRRNKRRWRRWRRRWNKRRWWRRRRGRRGGRCRGRQGGCRWGGRRRGARRRRRRSSCRRWRLDRRGGVCNDDRLGFVLGSDGRTDSGEDEEATDQRADDDEDLLAPCRARVARGRWIHPRRWWRQRAATWGWGKVRHQNAPVSAASSELQRPPIRLSATLPMQGGGCQ